MSATPELSEAERIRVEAFGMDKPEVHPQSDREEIVRILDIEGAQTGECGHEPGDVEDCVNGCRELLEAYADALIGAGFSRAQAVSLPDREDLARIIQRGSAEAFFNGSRGASALAQGSADAVLAALSPASIPEIPDNSVAPWTLEAQVHTIIADLDRARANGTVYTYGNIQERLRNALRLAALSTQPAAGEVEWEYGALTPDRLGMDVMVDNGTVPVLSPPEQIYRRRKAGPWIEVQPDAQPTELAELFPGTLAALDRLTIRPEVQS